MERVFNFCTIITANYISYAQALNDSLLSFSPNICFTVLIVDRNSSSPISNTDLKSSINCIYFDQILQPNNTSIDCNNSIHNYGINELRWSLKPSLLKFLVRNTLEPIIYLDVDLYFVNPFDFIFDYFNEANFLLSPHFRSIEPINSNSSFEKVFTQGFFNAGFIGANHLAISILEWWEAACSLKCTKDIDLGYYYDQRFLDIIPHQFDNVGILKHQGCNIASWNIDTCKRSYLKGRILINNEFPIVFIHFSRDTCEQIIFGSDKILLPLLNTYGECIEYYNPSISFINNIKEVHEKKVKEYYQNIQKMSIVKRLFIFFVSSIRQFFNKTTI